MPDQAQVATEEQQQATQVETQTQTEQKSAQADPSNDGLPYLTDVERKEWRTKGKLPERFEGGLEEDGAESKRLTSEERDKWLRTGELPERKTQETSKVAADESEIDASVAERVWAGTAQESETQQFLQRANTHGVGVLQYLQKNPQSLSTLQSAFVERPPAMWQDFVMSTLELKNATEVIAHVSTSQNARDQVLSCPNAMTLRATVQQISRGLSNKPKTKASPPPDEVGGRAESPSDPIDSALRNNDFRTTKSLWNKQYMRKHGRG